MRPEQMSRDELIEEVRRLRYKSRAHRKGLREMNRALAQMHKSIDLMNAEREIYGIRSVYTAIAQHVQ